MTIRVGIIGCGMISELHTASLCAQAGVDVIACADTNLEASQRCADQFEIPKVLSNSDDLLDLDEIDLVAICVPPKWHEQMFLNALVRNKHVLIEKPLAMDLAGADRMVEATEKTDRIVGVPLIHRYAPGYYALNQLLGCGAIGSVQLARLEFGKDMYGDSRFAKPQIDPRSWLVDRDIAGGGLLMSSSIHFLSALSYVLGNPSATSVTARVKQLHPKAMDGIEDDIDLSIQLENGTELVLHESWKCDIPYKCEITGDRGKLVMTAGSLWNDLSISGQCQGDVPKKYQPFLTGDQFHADSSELTAPFSPWFDGLAEDLVGSIRSGIHSPRLPSVSHARNMQAIISACYQSERSKALSAVDWRKTPGLLPSISEASISEK